MIHQATRNDSSAGFFQHQPARPDIVPQGTKHFNIAELTVFSGLIHSPLISPGLGTEWRCNRPLMDPPSLNQVISSFNIGYQFCA